jgi:hypothetical protein
MYSKNNYMTKQKLRKLSEVSENIAILSLREIND